MRNYVGSVAIDSTGELLATSSPHGGLIAFWDTVSGAYLGVTELADGSGVAPLSAGEVMLAPSRRGAIVEAGPGIEEPVVPEGQSGLGWDNLRSALPRMIRS